MKVLHIVLGSSENNALLSFLFSNNLRKQEQKHSLFVNIFHFKSMYLEKVRQLRVFVNLDHLVVPDTCEGEVLDVARDSCREHQLLFVFGHAVSDGFNLFRKT